MALPSQKVDLKKVVSCQLSVVSGQWSVVSGQWAVGAGGFQGWVWVVVGCSSQTLGERMPGRISPLGMIQKSSTATVGVVTTAGVNGVVVSQAVWCGGLSERLSVVFGKPRCERGSLVAWLPSSPPSRMIDCSRLGAGEGAATRGAGRSGSCCQPLSGDHRQASLSHVRMGLPSGPGFSEAPPIIRKSLPLVAAVARMRGVPGQSGSRFQPCSGCVRSSVHVADSAGAELGVVWPPEMNSRFPTRVPW